MASAEEVVRGFCDAVSARDTEVLRPYLADDVVYHNIGMPAAIGVEDVLADLAGQWAMFGSVYEWEIVHIASVGDVVLTERTDRVGGDGPTMPVPVMGVFEVRDGRIAHLRDYFDLALVGKLGAGEDVAALLP